MNLTAVKAALLEGLRLNRWPIVAIVTYVACAELAGRVYGFKIDLGAYNDVWIVLNLTVLSLAVAGLLLHGLIKRQPERPFAFARELLVKDWEIGRRAAAALPMFLLLPVFFSSFSSVKSAIGTMGSYHFDPLFVRMDRMLFLGHDPWSAMQPLLGWPIVTFALNFCYNLWFFLFYSVMACVLVTTGRPEMRNQFLLSTVAICGLLGGVGAVLFASVGPCFYADFYSNAPHAFVEMAAYLKGANTHYPIWALETQHMLLDAERTGKPVLGEGITAMPSVHVALAMLMAIVGWRVSRWAGIGGTVFLALILIGSVHLGWHYAVDGIASLIATPLIWLAAGWVARLPFPSLGFAPAGRPAPV